MLKTANVSTTPRLFDFNSIKGDVRTPFPVALARKMFSRSSYRIMNNNLAQIGTNDGT